MQESFEENVSRRNGFIFLLVKTGGMGKNSKRSVSGMEQSVVMWLGSLGEAGW